MCVRTEIETARARARARAREIETGIEIDRDTVEIVETSTYCPCTGEEYEKQYSPKELSEEEEI